MWTVGGRAGYIRQLQHAGVWLRQLERSAFRHAFGLERRFRWLDGRCRHRDQPRRASVLERRIPLAQLDPKTLYSGSLKQDGRTWLTYKVTDQPDIQTGRLVLTYKLNSFGPKSLK